MGCKGFVTLALAASSVIIASAAQADTKAGIDAWAAGNYPLAVQEWQASVISGDVVAMYHLGQAYRMGKGTAQDLAKAEELFRQAAAQGHAASADNYGLLLFNRGEKKQAMPYLQTAANRGDARAQYLLGLAYFNADTVERDWPRAYALVNLARKQGLEQATSALQQIDSHISAEQREQGLALSTELQARIDGKSPARVASSSPAPAVAGVPKQRLPDPERKAPASKPAAAKLARAEVAPVPAAPKAAAKAKPVAAPKPATAPKAAATGPWRVQLGAFSQAANANAMWNRVKNRPELAGHPRINSAAGNATRLQAGGFPSRAAAMEACARLKAGGFDCLPVSG